MSLGSEENRRVGREARYLVCLLGFLSGSMSSVSVSVPVTGVVPGIGSRTIYQVYFFYNFSLKIVIKEASLGFEMCEN